MEGGPNFKVSNNGDVIYAVEILPKKMIDIIVREELALDDLQIELRDSLTQRSIRYNYNKKDISDLRRLLRLDFL